MWSTPTLWYVRTDSSECIEPHTHTEGQPHSDLTLNCYTGDVVVTALRMPDTNKDIGWLLEDSPRTPKMILADAESSSDVNKVKVKVTTLQAAMKAYSIDGRCVLGLILGGNMMLKVYTVSEGQFMEYPPLHNKDLSEMAEMTEEIRSTLLIVRSRSSSVVSTHSSASGHEYSLRSRGPVI